MLHRSLFTLHKQQNDFSIDFLVKLSFEYSFSIIYTYKKRGDDSVNLEKSPSSIRTIAASLWTIPAIILSYLFQNRAELFFLEIIYISALFSSIGVGFSELPFGKIFTVVSILPCIANSYYFILLFPFDFQVPSLADILKFIFLFILFSIPTLLLIVVAIIPIFTIPVFLVSLLFMLISDVIYTLIKKLSASFIVYTSLAVIACIFIVRANFPPNFQLQPLPTNIVSSQAVSESTSKNYSNKEARQGEEVSTTSPVVWIPTHGGTKYHRRSTCSGMEDPEITTKEDAIARGFEACQRCY